ncbi:ABC-type lipoprotein export system ATPase subunit [Arthrobacter sp. UYEF21]
MMGPSGSGKSSLLALAGGLDRPTSGGVYVESTPLGGLGLNELARLRRRAVGYVFQDFNLRLASPRACPWRTRGKTT